MELLDGHELLKRMRQTDYDAFEELHRKYYPSLFRMAVKKIGDEDEAFDLLQDLFAELWEKREQLYVPNALEAWLRNRLWFKLSGYFRSKGFREKHFRNFAEFLNVEHADALEDIEVQEINQQYEAMMRVIEQTVNEMPIRMKSIFLMSRNGNISIKEIAIELQLSPKTVKNQINLAFNRIRRALAGSSLTTIELLFLLWLTKI